jgi:hypothetical protein
MMDLLMSIESNGMKPCCYGLLRSLQSDPKFTRPQAGDVIHCDKCGAQIVATTVMDKAVDGEVQRTGRWTIRR